MEAAAGAGSSGEVGDSASCGANSKVSKLHRLPLPRNRGLPRLRIINSRKSGKPDLPAGEGGERGGPGRTDRSAHRFGNLLACRRVESGECTSCGTPLPNPLPQGESSPYCRCSPHARVSAKLRPHPQPSSPGSTGRSSTPRLLGSSTAASGILDHPLSRVMTSSCVASVGACHSTLTPDGSPWPPRRGRR
ncbi:hypothetical protein ACVW17_000039 [Bradyrhizobium sp. USDA 4473]